MRAANDWMYVDGRQEATTFRQFLYLDRQLVREFLAQLEGGVYDESRELTAGGRNRGITAKLSGGPAQAGMERTKSNQAESEAVVKQTSASEFDRLYTQLEVTGLQVYDVVDETLDHLPIKRKDIVEVDARLHVSGLHKVLEPCREIQPAFAVDGEFRNARKCRPRNN